MELYPGISIVDLCLLVGKTLVISDVHFGYEEALNAKGVCIPRHQWKDTKKRLDAIFSVHVVDTVVFNGDLKHEIGHIRETEWRYILRVIDFMQERASVVIVRGNHDVFLEPIARKRNIVIESEWKIGNVLIIHGDEVIVPGANIDVLIMGHEHCAITFTRGNRVEKYKCFLKGKWKGFILIAMPSFHELTCGTDVLAGELLSPLLRDVSKFEVYAIGDIVYSFGRVRDLRRIIE